MSSLADILKGNGLDVSDEFASNTNEYDRLIESINKGTGSFEQVYDFTDRTGQAASNYLKKQCESQLVDGQVPQEVVDSVVKPVLESVSQVSSETANALCAAENHKKSINVTLQNPPVDKSTVNGMGNKLMSGPYDQTSWIIGDGPVSNLAMHSVDQTIQANAEFIAKSGRRARIRRRSEANCCEWCENLAGEWDYGEEPKDVYRRHNNCRCVVEYIVDGMAQNVWNKSDVPQDQKVHEDSGYKLRYKLDPQFFGKPAAVRVNNHSQSWKKVSLSETLNKFFENPVIFFQNGNKIGYTSEESHYQIIVETVGDLRYFRIYDNNLRPQYKKGLRCYTDINGSDLNKKYNFNSTSGQRHFEEESHFIDSDFDQND